MKPINKNMQFLIQIWKKLCEIINRDKIHQKEFLFLNQSLFFSVFSLLASAA